MTPVPLDSSVLSNVVYEWDTRTLRLTFRSGAVYDYLEVPWQVFDQLMNSNSKDWTFHQVIKPRFKSTRIEPKAEP